MKLGPESKLDKSNKTTSKKDNDVMSGNCDVFYLTFFQLQDKRLLLMKM